MSNPMVRFHDIETNEVIDREMTDSEYEEYKKSLLPSPAELEKIKAKNDLLAKLGITAEEAALLLG